MSGAPLEPAREDLDLILFQVGDVRLGAQADQVLSALPVEATGAKNVLWLHDLVGMPDGPVHRHPVALELRNGSVRIGVDHLESLVRKPLSELRPLPSLIEAKALERGFWAALPEDTGMVLLVDLYRLLQSRPDTPSDTSPS